MLDHEFSLLRERLDAKIGGEKTLFVFADYGADSFGAEGACLGLVGWAYFVACMGW